LSLPSLCSSTAREDNNRASAEREATGLGLDLNWIRAWHTTERPALEIILKAGLRS
jgi:hypothetical protein